jgi:hypothetical protein
MARPEWRDLSKERRWRRLLGQWRRSGRTGRDFCAERELSEPSFYAWKREIARRDQERTARPQALTRTKASRDHDRAARPQAPTRTAASRRPVATGLPAFVPVTVEAAGAWALEVVVAPGRLLRVRAGFDAAVLRRLLAVLEEPAC